MEVLVIDAHEGSVNSVVWSADGKSVVSGGEDGAVTVWGTQ